MNNFKVGDLINTNLPNSIVISKYNDGKDAILYSKSNYMEEYVYVYNIKYDEDDNKYIWSSGDYYESLESCMANVISKDKDLVYPLFEKIKSNSYKEYIKGIVKTELEIKDEGMLDDIYFEYMDNDEVTSIISKEFQDVKNEAIKNSIVKNHELWLESDGRDGKKLEKKNYNEVFENIIMDNEVSNCNLTKANFSDQYLNEMKFTKTSLIEATFEETYIENTRFYTIDLTKTNMSNAELVDNIVIDGSLLVETTFENSRLENIRINDSNLSDVNFDGAGLYNVDFKNCEIFTPSFKSTITEKSELKFCNFVDVNICNGNFENVIIENTNFYDVNLEDVKFKDIVIKNAILDEVTLNNVDFTNTIFENVTMDKEVKEYILNNGGTIKEKQSLLEKAPTTSKYKEYER